MYLSVCYKALRHRYNINHQRASIPQSSIILDAEQADMLGHFLFDLSLQILSV